MRVRQFKFEDQQLIFSWWHSQALARELPGLNKASEWTAQLLNNPLAFSVVEDTNTGEVVIGIIEFIQLFQSNSGNLAKVFLFTPYSQYKLSLSYLACGVAKELKDFDIKVVQYTQQVPQLVELWIDQVVPSQEPVKQEEVKEQLMVTSTVTDPVIEKPKKKRKVKHGNATKEAQPVH